jgi:hypothetical protein
MRGHAFDATNGMIETAGMRVGREVHTMGGASDDACSEGCVARSHRRKPILLLVISPISENFNRFAV